MKPKYKALDRPCLSNCSFHRSLWFKASPAFRHCRTANGSGRRTVVNPKAFFSSFGRKYDPYWHHHISSKFTTSWWPW